MKTFAENLDDFQKLTGFSTAEIAELAQIDREALNALKSGSNNFAAMCEFCANSEIAYTSIYSDAGFQSIPVYQQYADMPFELKQIVTKHLVDALGTTFTSIAKEKRSKAATRGKEVAKEFLMAHLAECSKQKVTRIWNGHSIIPADMLPAFQKGLSPKISESKFKLMLCAQMYSTIHNYNYNLLRKQFELGYQDIADALNVSYAFASKWGGISGISIPANHRTKLVDLFEELSLDEFNTQILTRERISHISCKLSLGNKLPDPPSDNNEKPTETLKEDIEPKIDTETESTGEMNQSARLAESTSSTYTVNIGLTDEVTFKMFSKLPQTDKDKIREEITRLFLTNL